MSAEQSSEAAAIAAIVRDSVNRVVPTAVVAEALDGSGILVFQDQEVVDLRSYRATPDRKRGVVHLQDTPSFVKYINAHKIPGKTHVFGKIDDKGGSFRAVLDYHEVGGSGAPSWATHIALLTLAFTPQWATWVKSNRVEMSPDVFSEFIRDNGTDIVSPSAGELADMCLSLEATKSGSFKSAMNLKSGSVKIAYEEVVELRGGPANTAQQSLEIPDTFTLGIVPFVGAAGVSQTCKIRFRLRGSDLKLFYVMEAPHKNIDTATQLAREAIEEGTQLTVYLGSV